MLLNKETKPIKILENFMRLILLDRILEWVCGGPFVSITSFVSCTIPSGSPFPSSHTYCVPFVLVCSIHIIIIISSSSNSSSILHLVSFSYQF